MRWQWCLFWARDQGSSTTVINSQGLNRMGGKYKYMHMATKSCAPASIFARLEMQAKFKTHHAGAARFDTMPSWIWAKLLGKSTYMDSKAHICRATRTCRHSSLSVLALDFVTASASGALLPFLLIEWDIWGNSGNTPLLLFLKIAEQVQSSLEP